MQQNVALGKASSAFQHQGSFQGTLCRVAPPVRKHFPVGFTSAHGREDLGVPMGVRTAACWGAEKAGGLGLQQRTGHLTVWMHKIQGLASVILTPHKL